MENPATWGKAEHVVNDTIAEHDQVMRMSPGLCGLSLARRITDALREAGFHLDREDSR